MANFITKCINGSAQITEIDDYINSWHLSESTETLHDYLGFTEEEYSLWILNTKSLEQLIFGRKS